MLENKKEIKIEKILTKKTDRHRQSKRNHNQNKVKLIKYIFYVLAAKGKSMYVVFTYVCNLINKRKQNNNNK